MSERVLVPLDDSEPARGALEEALERFGTAEIVVLHVVDTSDSSHGIQGSAAENVYDAREDEAGELFEEARRTASGYGVTLETAIETGQPAEEIVGYVRAHDVDHVVMGSHGRSGISRLLVGSVAEHVIRDAPVSVTVSRRHVDSV